MEDRSKEFIDLLQQAKRMWPSLRMGQILANAITKKNSPDLFYWRDEDLCEALKEYMKRNGEK